MTLPEYFSATPPTLSATIERPEIPDPKRPGWEQYFLDGAAWAATRADCTRRQVGAIIVKDHRIKATGYNGAPAGWPGCLTEQACPRGQHFKSGPDQGGEPYCGGCGMDWPCQDAAPSFEQGNHDYVTGGNACIAQHAEINALLESSRIDRQGATMYITDAPCDNCLGVLGGSGIKFLVWPEGTWERRSPATPPHRYAEVKGVWGRLS